MRLMDGAVLDRDKERGGLESEGLDYNDTEGALWRLGGRKAYRAALKDRLGDEPWCEA